MRMEKKNMVIVKFKDNSYGIRRISVLSALNGTFEFLDKKDNYWWGGSEYHQNYSFKSLEDAKKRLGDYMAIKPVAPDYGEVVY